MFCKQSCHVERSQISTERQEQEEISRLRFAPIEMKTLGKVLPESTIALLQKRFQDAHDLTCIHPEHSEGPLVSRRGVTE